MGTLGSGTFGVDSSLGTPPPKIPFLSAKDEVGVNPLMFPLGPDPDAAPTLSPTLTDPNLSPVPDPDSRFPRSSSNP